MRCWPHAGLLMVIFVLGGATRLDHSPAQDDGHELVRKCLTGLQALDAQQWGGSTLADFGWCMGYILGVVEGAGMVVADLRAPQPGAPVIDAWCPRGLALPVEHLARVLVAWLRQHPALLPLPRPALMRAVLADTFPCPSAPQAGSAK